MSLSSFLIRIIFLALPGIISSILYRKFRGRPVRKDWEDYVQIVIFSLLSYALYGLAVFALNKLKLYGGSFTVLGAFFDEKTGLVWHEIIIASLIGILLAFVAAYIHTHKVVTRVGQFVRATKSFGEEDIWHYLHNKPDVYWVYVRDHKYDLSYRCWIEAYSDPFKERELLLREVSVYRTSTGDFLYPSDVIYLSRDHNELTIEAAVISDSTVVEESASEAEKTLEEAPPLISTGILDVKSTKEVK